jgi:CRP/FNR family transcriptional regulator
MPEETTSDFNKKLDELVYVRRRLKSGNSLYHTGDNFQAIYAVRSGFIKTESLHDDGRVQITGFYMAGEIFGFDGIATEKHMSTSIALEDSEICIIPLDRVKNFSREFTQIQNHFFKLMSREIVRDHTIMMLLGSMQGEERIAAFMLNLSQRFYARGYSQYNIVLRMKREEIGSYLGMKVETVSRIFTKFQDQKLLSVQQKNIRILDVEGLRKCIGQHPNK